MAEAKLCGCRGACGHDRKPADVIDAAGPERFYRAADGSLVKTKPGEFVPTLLNHYRQQAPNVFVRRRARA